MLCSQCQKRPANVHITKVINGKKTELHLCEQCAREHDKLDFFDDENFSVQNLLAGILNNDFFAGVQPGGVIRQQYCPSCGLTFSDFSRLGRFGCGQCYETFKQQLNGILKRIHGNQHHSGKIPSQAGEGYRLRQEIRRLREELAMAVKQEEFERAAELRDKINILEQQLKGKQA